MSYILSIAEANTTQVNTRNPITDVRILSVDADMAHAIPRESITSCKNAWKVWAAQMKSAKLSSGWKFTPNEEDDDYTLRFSKVTRTINGERKECVYTCRVWKLN